MTTRHTEPIICECGHQGTLHWSENDAPFSKQWEAYRVSGFEGEGFEVAGFTTNSEALERINPKCTACGQTGKVKCS